MPQHPRRDFWSRRIAALDPVEDHHEIVRILSMHEFPWDLNQALSLALFRTYAVPSIGRLLAETGEFTERVQRRYDDTALLLDHVLAHGVESTEGRRAVRRINQMHGRYDISNDDMRYVLATFVVVPIRWMDAYAWRPFSEAEKVASTTYYRRLGHHMGIRGVPETWQAFETLLDEYEDAHFAHDEGARRVADSTLDLMLTFPLNDKAPATAVRRFSYALMDAPLLDAFGYPHPRPWERRAAAAALRARSAYVRLTPPRLRAKTVEDLPQVRSYPDGFDVDRLGTFPVAACPVAH